LSWADAVVAPGATKAAANDSDTQNAFFIQYSPFFSCNEPAQARSFARAWHDD
jgi:hypothetical protein